MIEQFRKKRFSPESFALLKKALAIIEEYKRQHITMTLRQLYYQLVSQDVIPNNLKSYKRLGTILADGRYAGLVDWEAIEDRIRVPKRHSQFDDVLDLVEAAKASYRLDRWAGQKYYVELFTEKDALASVLKPIADKWHIYFCVNRGYSSATAMYDTAKRIEEEFDEEYDNDKMEVTMKKKAVILYLGDHDPSGLDMVRDIKERIVEFLIGRRDYTDFTDDSDYEIRKEIIEENIEVIHIALTTEQVKKYKPPPNPAKMTDTRSTGYINRFGKSSWEVDALKPEVMIKLVDDAIKQYVDVDKMNKIIEQEKQDMKAIEEFAKKLKENPKRKK